MANPLDQEKYEEALHLAEEFTKPGTANVSPADRKKLAPLIKHYMSKPKPFTACVRDQLKHGLTKDHANRRCAVIKDLGTGTTKWRGKHSLADEMDELLASVDQDKLALLLEIPDDELVRLYVENELSLDGTGLDEGDAEGLNLAFGRGTIKFDPRDHPRDPNGRFRSLLNKLMDDSDSTKAIRLPNKTRITKADGGKVAVRLQNKEERAQLLNPEDATIIALNDFNTDPEMFPPENVRIYIGTKRQREAAQHKHRLEDDMARLSIPDTETPLNLDQYNAALDEARQDLNLTVFNWDPDLHPRDLRGRFRKILDGLSRGDAVALPDPDAHDARGFRAEYGESPVPWKVRKIGEGFRIEPPSGRDYTVDSADDVLSDPMLGLDRGDVEDIDPHDIWGDGISVLEQSDDLITVENEHDNDVFEWKRQDDGTWKGIWYKDGEEVYATMRIADIRKAADREFEVDGWQFA